MAVRDDLLQEEQVESLVMEYDLDNMRHLCNDIREGFGNSRALEGLFKEMHVQERWLSDGTSACLLAASMHSFLIRHLAVGRSLGNIPDERLASSVGELRAALSANVVAENERGKTEPEYSVVLARDLVNLSAVAAQPIEENVGAGASLLLTMYEQARTSLN